MKIVLPGERPLSWNKLYNGTMHWGARANEARRVHELIRNKIDGWKLLTGPVDITITAFFRMRPLDADNICSKIFIDALKGIVIRDDTLEYVSSVTTKSRRDILRPRVELEINYAGGES